MRTAAGKDIRRTIWKEKKRFISIMLITALGVTMMTGLSVGCSDLRYSADRFFDDQQLFDVSVLSTLGLTQEDVDVLSALEGVKKGEGSYSEVVHTKKGSMNKTAEVKTVQDGGMNLPYVLEGSLPTRADEIAVTGNYISDTGKAIGDKVMIEELPEDTETKGMEEEEEEAPNFLYTEFTIVGVAVDAMDINNADSSAAFRVTPNADYTFFVLPEAVESEVFTAVYLSLEGTEDMLCYSPEYEERVADLVSRIEGEIKEQREQARYEAVTGEAYGKINDAQTEMDEAFAEAKEELTDAEKEIADGWQEIGNGWQEIEDGKKELSDKEQEAAAEIADARVEIADGYERLEEGEKELQDAANQLYEGNLAMAKGRAELEDKEAQVKEQIAQGEAALAAKKEENDQAKAAIAVQVAQVCAEFGEVWPTEAWNNYVFVLTQIMLPAMQGQMSDLEGSMTAEQQQAFAEAVRSNPTVLQSGEDFGMALLERVTQAKETLIQEKEEGEGRLVDVDSAILAQEQTVINLENEISDWESQIAGWEQDKIDINNQDSSAPDLDEELDRQIEEAKSRIEQAQMEKEEALAVQVQLTGEKEQIESGLNQIEEKIQRIEGTAADADQTLAQLSGLAIQVAGLEATEQILEQAASDLAGKKAEAQAQIDAAWEEIEAGEARLADATRQIHEGKAELEENRLRLEDAVRELEENEQKAKQEFADARGEIAAAQQELLEGEQKLLDGQQELEDGWLEYEEEKAKAEDEIAQAKAKVEDLDMTQWYVQDRTSLSGYVNVESDALSIESLASVFTIVFFVVAILISLTTVTRMVEEERGLIGTYKALGFTDHEIRKKYVIYAFAASVSGGMLGDVCSFIVLPKILFLFFDMMYLFPAYTLQFNFYMGTIGVLLFMLGSVGAAVWACEAELRHLPAQLMRPKAPKSGSRVLLERFTLIWKRLSFLNKVAARNLFRYKKRLFMTVLGIAGCTALILFGFAIKDSVAELMPLQYERVYKYDLLAAASAKDNERLLEYMAENEEVEEYLNIQVETVKLKNSEGDTEKIQIMIFPTEADVSSYITLTNVDKEAVGLSREGIYLTENAAKILGVKKGDTAFIQKLNLAQRQVQISEVVKNYLGNNIYMSEEAYEAAFGGYEPNGILANLSDSCQDQTGFSDTLSMEDWILFSISVEELKEGFSTAFTLVNVVVYVVLVLAAGLAFVVLFTLASTNISERIRELATIKVLGFFDREVHLYINKESLILTGIGILLGLPLGAVISSSLTNILDMPSVYFEVTIYPVSFFISAGISLAFALAVQFLTDRGLDRIDMVEALKSVE